jgi:hypothetical protein
MVPAAALIYVALINKPQNGTSRLEPLNLIKSPDCGSFSPTIGIRRSRRPARAERAGAIDSAVGVRGGTRKTLVINMFFEVHGGR